MKRTHLITAAGCMVGLLIASEALAERSCAAYWALPKRWWNDGSENNSWVARCVPGIDATWLQQQSDRQYVACFKFTAAAGVMQGHVYAPTYTAPAQTLMNVACRNDIEFSELLYKDCLTPTQPVKFRGAYLPIAEASRLALPTVTTLVTSPGMEGAMLGERAIRNFTSTPFIGNTYLLKLTSGSELELTGNHPLVRSDGLMVEAETLNVGDALLRADGDTDGVISVSQKPYSGDVWNVRPNSEKKIENVMVVRDVLTGSSRFTERWADEETRLVRTRTINIRGL